MKGERLGKFEEFTLLAVRARVRLALLGDARGDLRYAVRLFARRGDARGAGADAPRRGGGCGVGLEEVVTCG